MPGRDTRTRWQGIFARHQFGCAVAKLPPKPPLAEIASLCNCKPGYYAKVYHRSEQRYLATRRKSTITAARTARRSLLEELETVEVSDAHAQRLSDARTAFIDAAREGRALNKHGRPYKRSAWEDIDECLGNHVVPKLGARRLTDIRRADIQYLVDDLAPKLSGSRVRSVVNAIRSLYRWAQDRELAAHDPAALLRLPAMNATVRDRIATPVEFAALLSALDLRDALPYALARLRHGTPSGDPTPPLARHRPRYRRHRMGRRVRRAQVSLGQTRRPDGQAPPRDSPADARHPSRMLGRPSCVPART